MAGSLPKVVDLKLWVNGEQCEVAWQASLIGTEAGSYERLPWQRGM